jgi:DNA ligase (NAD+)
MKEDNNYKKYSLIIDKLSKLIKKWDYEYYILDQPSVSDHEYDQTLFNLKKIEEEYPSLIKKDSPTQRLNLKISKQFEKTKHSQQLLSLLNVFNYDQLLNFDKQIRKLTNLDQIEYVCELKIDGLTIALFYENKFLIKAATRGNGIFGENVFNNIKTIKSVPLSLSDDRIINLRGEIFLNKKEFIRINKNQLKLNLSPFVNLRNAASGSLRQLNPNITSQRKLNNFIYSFLAPKPSFLKNQIDSLNYLKKLKFKVNPNFKLCKDIKTAWSYIKFWEEEKNNLDYEIDGVVIKVNDFNLYEKIGKTNKAPKWEVAYKFDSVSEITEIKDILVTVGRTGKINYIADIKEVEINGTKINKATLHNAEYIKNKDIRINDWVKVKKAGDIIPYIVVSIPEMRVKKLSKWENNKNCPSCQKELKIKNEADINQYCLNQNYCYQQIIKRLVHFVSSQAMNIIGLSEGLIIKLFNHNLIKNIVDFFYLKNKKEEFIKIRGLGEKIFLKIIQEIEKSKNNSLEKLIYGLSINYVGSKTALLIAKRFKTMEQILKSTQEEILDIENIGSITANEIINFFQKKENISLINQLKELNINFNYLGEIDQKIKKDNQINIVISGKLSKERNFFNQLINQKGFNLQKKISRKTNYLLIGKKYSHEKFKKANEFKIKIINETEFQNIK